MILTGLVAARFAHYLALVVLFGAAAFQVGAQDAEPASSGLLRRRRKVLFWAALGALASGLAVLGLTAANLAGGLGAAADPVVLRTVVGETDYGRVWVLRLVVAACLILLFAARWRLGAVRWVAIAGSGALIASLALTGHAQTASGMEGALHRLSDAAHLLAAGVWLGALPVFLFLLRETRTAAPGRLLATGRLLERFHLVGLSAVAVLIGSGLVNSWFLVGDVANLPSTPYGRLLLLKLALFAGMVAFAADNRLRLVPRLNLALARGLPAETWLARLRGHVRAEFGLGLAVLAIVAALGAMAPAVQAGAAG